MKNKLIEEGVDEVDDQLNQLQKIAQVWRAGRLLSGKTQKELSRILGLSQASISKYESMLLEPSASDWYRFCEFAGLDAHKTLELGYIDGKKKFKHRLHSNSAFSLPMRYRGDFYLKVRELIPFKDFIIEKLGNEFWLDFLKNHGIPSDIFLIYDFQISLNFLLDLRKDTQKHGFDLLDGALGQVRKDHSHGVLQYEYLKKKSGVDLLKAVMDSQAYYQNVFEIQSKINEKSISCEFHPSLEASEIFKMEDLQIYMNFKVKSFQEILKMRNFQDDKFEIQQKENTIYFKLAS
jgi:transcriptional regulator with XRE-family HTH domain